MTSATQPIIKYLKYTLTFKLVETTVKYVRPKKPNQQLLRENK